MPLLIKVDNVVTKASIREHYLAKCGPRNEDTVGSLFACELGGNLSCEQFSVVAFENHELRSHEAGVPPIDQCQPEIGLGN
jgi:hypothetical protein